MHFFINTSGAPFVIILYFLPILCIVVIIFLVESNGISFILGIFSYSSDFLKLFFIAKFVIATSVGSPIDSEYCSSVSVHIVPSSIINFCSSSFALPFMLLTWTTVILFWVKVPVLSEHITVLLPRVSTAGSFLIMLFLFAILVTPIESIIVTIAGNPSGMAATASPTDVINISTIGIFLKIPIINIRTQIIMHAIARIFPTSPNFFWIGVSGASSSIIIPAILPTLVFIPVSVTTASPWPFTTIVVA